MTQIIDRDGRATVASAEGQAALDAGDTERAREKFASAGELLEHELAEAKEDASEHLLRFLAATQFYKGGHYQRALELAKKIKADKLPASSGRLLTKFMQDVKSRARRDYEAHSQKQLHALWTAHDYAGIIEMLKEDPYIITPTNLAFTRAVCCERLGKYRAAVLFFADAARLSQNNPEVLAALAPLPVQLVAQGRLADAWEYSQAQLDLFPNVVSYAVASILCYYRAFHAEGDRRTSILRDQARYFDRAREEYARLPASHHNQPVMRQSFTLAYETRAWALFRFFDSVTEALKLCDDALAFDPALPNIWTLRGIILSSKGTEARLNSEAATAFQKAVALGDKTYLPYYYLARDAWTKGEFRETLNWSNQALAQLENQDPQIKSLLYQWVAISLVNLGGPRKEIISSFKKAIAVAPDNELAKKNYRHFQKSERLEPPPFLFRPDIFRTNRDFAFLPTVSPTKWNVYLLQSLD